MKKILPLLFILLLNACETEHPFPSEDSGRIYIHALISDSGTSTVNIGVSQPLGVDRTSVNPKYVNVHIEADGTPVDLTINSENSSDMILTYHTEYDFKSGQEVILKATCPGLESAQAQVAIPEEITGMTVGMREIDCFKESDSHTSANYLRTLWEFGITIDDAADVGDAYGIQVLRKKMYELTGDVYRPEDYTEDMGLIETADLYVSSNTGSSNGSITSVGTEMVIGFDGGETKIEHIVYDNARIYLTACVEPTEKRMIQNSFNPTSNENYSIYEYYEYKIRVYRLSDETYNYIRARYIAESHEIPVHLGFSPATYTYTNVIGGIGVFGAAAVYETDWTIYE